MKKLITFIIAAILFLFVMSSCTPLIYGEYDANDYYYDSGSPYYHREHYYNDFYFDKSSSYYHREHFYRDQNQNRDTHREATINHNEVIRHDDAITPNNHKDAKTSRVKRSNVRRNAKIVDNHKDNKNEKK